MYMRPLRRKKRLRRERVWALARILLRERFGVTPQLESLPIGSDVEATSADAVLLIGDRAIHPPEGEFIAAWDLGNEWCRWAESSFVFAMWTARAGIDVTHLGPALEQARDEGVANLEQIAANEAAKVGLLEDECIAYLRDNLYFYLGPREHSGLELFRQHAAQLDLTERSLS